MKSSAELLGNIIPITETGCWLWMGYVSKETGYGIYNSPNNKKILMHRYFYEHHKGEIREGLVIDHKCRVRCCVNPDHLEAVTLSENVLRGEGHTAINARKVHCKIGHLIEGVSGKNRYCTECKRQRNLINIYARKNGISREAAKSKFTELDVCRI